MDYAICNSIKRCLAVFIVSSGPGELQLLDFIRGDSRAEALHHLSGLQGCRDLEPTLYYHPSYTILTVLTYSRPSMLHYE
jgi:hypothetical protein